MQAMTFSYEKKRFVGSNSISRFKRLMITSIMSFFSFILCLDLPFLFALVGHPYFVLTLIWSYLLFLFGHASLTFWISQVLWIFHYISSVIDMWISVCHLVWDVIIIKINYGSLKFILVIIIGCDPSLSFYIKKNLFRLKWELQGIYF